MDNYVVNYERRYTKFQEVLSNLGRLFKALFTIIYVLNYALFREMYYIVLISVIFKTKEENKIIETIQKHVLVSVSIRTILYESK